jgi:hypothetical protein
MHRFTVRIRLPSPVRLPSENYLYQSLKTRQQRRASAIQRAVSRRGEIVERLSFLRVFPFSEDDGHWD